MSPMKKIFVFVSGQTPQIITETIYALNNQTPPIHPNEIIVITTSEGSKVAKQFLEGQGILRKLCEEYNIPEFKIRYEVPHYKDGVPVYDIRTSEDNEIMANLIHELIKNLSKDQDTELHCSIAGGRKTMSFYLGAALQLYGRLQDKLYHVLVSPEFETNKNFFYKPKQDVDIKTNDGRIINTRDAKIEIAELPFIRLGGKVDIKAENFFQAVKDSQKFIEESILDKIKIRLKSNLVKIGKTEFKLPPTLLSIYALILERRKNCKNKNCKGCKSCYLPKHRWDKELKETYKKYLEKTEHTKLKDIDGMAKNLRDTTLASKIAKINEKLRLNIGDDLRYFSYRIHSETRYGETRYYLNLSKDKIDISE